MKKGAKKAKRCGKTMNGLLKKLTVKTVINADRMEDFDAVMNRQLAIWRQKSDAGMTQDSK